MKDKEKKTRIKKDRNILPGVILAGLLASVIIYAIMINAEKNALADYEKGTIFTAAKDVPEGILITEDNYSVYFQLKEVDKKLIPETAISSPEQLKGLAPCVKIDTGTLITMGMFESINEITKDMNEPVIAGFRAEDLYQVVGGVLRSGDRIHIYNVDEEGQAKLTWSNIYVEQVFDTAGAAITNEDTVTAAQRVNVYMDKDEVERFYSELSAGSLRVVKILD